MEGDQTTPTSSTTTAVGFYLLPSDLLHEILFRLTLPNVLLLRSVSRSLSSLISSDDFHRHYQLRSAACGGWIFVFMKHPTGGGVLNAFSEGSGRWFRLPFDHTFSPEINLSDAHYLLAASGDFLLFVSDSRRDHLAVNLAKRSARRVPASPLGPRGRKSCCRPALKLISGPPGSDQFRFIFAETQSHQAPPFLLEYRSDTDTWHSSPAPYQDPPQLASPEAGNVYLNAASLLTGSVVVRAGTGNNDPTSLRPKLPEGSGVMASRCYYVYGDGHFALVRWAMVTEGVSPRARVVVGVELWVMGSDGRVWELASRAPAEVVEKIKPYKGMKGTLEEREGVVRLILMSTLNGSWDLTWLSYGRGDRKWRWVPVADFGATWLDMAGIALSSSFPSPWPRLPGSRYVAY